MHDELMAVQRFGALCELASESEQQANFRISEYAVLDDDTELVLHSDRGYSTRIIGSTSIWHQMTAASIESDVRAVVLPDDAEVTGEAHPWEWLVTLLAEVGVTESVDHLRTVPYEVRIASDVLSRIGSGGAT